MALIGTDQLGNPYTITIDSVSGAILTAPAPGLSPSTGDNSIAQTALSLITSALRLINVAASGETLPVNEANDALAVFQQMVDGWNAESMAIYTTRSDDYPLQIGKQAYTLGPGGDFNTNRPPKIDAMSIILLTNPSNPIEVPIPIWSVQEWQEKIPVKNVPGTFPLGCYDDGGFPLRILNMWPIPQEVDNVRIYSWQPLTVPAKLTTAISYPPGYAEAFRYNLAIRLAPEFGAPISPVVADIAAKSLARVKVMNSPDLAMRSDLVLDPAGYNWRADMFGIPY